MMINEQAIELPIGANFMGATIVEEGACSCRDCAFCNIPTACEWLKCGSARNDGRDIIARR